jgi:hypothetical protein
MTKQEIEAEEEAKELNYSDDQETGLANQNHML